MTQDTIENTPELEEHEIIAQRKAKLAELREKGVAFPNHFRRDSLAAELHAQVPDSVQVVDTTAALDSTLLDASAEPTLLPEAVLTHLRLSGTRRSPPAPWKRPVRTACFRPRACADATTRGPSGLSPASGVGVQ